MSQTSSTALKGMTLPLQELTIPHGQSVLSDSIGHALFKNNPFAGLPGDYQVIEFPDGASAQWIIESATKGNEWIQDYLVVKIGEDYIPKEAWHLVKVKHNAPIYIMVVPQGGGNIISTIASVVVAVAAVAVMVALTPVVGPVLAAVAAMAVTLVGNMLVNALFPPPQLQLTGLSITPEPIFSAAAIGGTAAMKFSMGMGSSQVDPTYGFNADTNQNLQYSPVPRIYGKVKMAPTYAAKPYVESIGNDQFMYLLFDFGTGPIKLEYLMIGENPIDTYKDLKYEIYPSFKKGDPLKYYNKDVFQIGYSLKLINGTWRTSTTTDKTNSAIIDFQFGQGMGAIDKYTGDLSNRSVTIRVQYRKVGDPDWLPYNGLAHKVSGTGTEGADGAINVTAATQRPFFTTLELTFPSAGEYELRTDRTTEESTDRYITDAVSLAAIRSIKDYSPLANEAPHTIVEMKILATNQLNGAVDNFTAIATSILPVWDGTKFIDQPTRNPAWAYLDVLRGTATVRPVNDSKIDLQSFKEWAAWCEEPAANAPGLPKNCCDLVISGEYTAWQVLKMVSACGDATPAMRSGKYSVAVDKLRDYPVQMFTPRNSWGFNAQRSYHIQPDALRVMYLDPDQDWQRHEVTVYDDGKDVNNSKIFEVLDLTGITQYHQAYREGRRALAQGRLRQETFTITVGVENILATRGDLVRLAYDIPKIGQGWARIKSISGDQIVLDDDVTGIANGNYVRVRVSDRYQVDLVVTELVGQNWLIVSGDTSELQPGQLVVYGEYSKITMDCLVKSISPGADLTASITLVPYAPAIYTAETEQIPEYDPLITADSVFRPGPVINLQVTEIDEVINRYHYSSIALSWAAPSGVYPKGYAIYEFSDGAWKYLGSTTQNSFYAYQDIKIVKDDGTLVSLIGKDLKFAVTAIGNAGVRISPELATSVNITPKGDAIKPQKPLFFDIDTHDRTTYLEWQHPANNDIDYYFIRYSPKFYDADINHSTFVAKRIPYPATNVTVPTRLGTYFIKTVDTTGLVSEEAAMAITATSLLNDSQELRTISDTDWSGSMVDVHHVGNGDIELNATGIVGNYFPQGMYYFEDTLDFGQIYSAYFDSQIEAFGLNGSSILSNWGLLSTVDPLDGGIDDQLWDAHLEIRSGTILNTLSGWGTLDTVLPSIGYGGGDFGPWTKFYSGQYTGRIFQFRLVLSSYDQNVGVRAIEAHIDVRSPIRVDGKYDIECPVGGIRIVYDKPFQEVPAVAVTQDDFELGDSYYITDKSRSGFSIEFFNQSTSVARQFDWVARGYGQEVAVIPQNINFLRSSHVAR